MKYDCTRYYYRHRHGVCRCQPENAITLPLSLYYTYTGIEMVSLYLLFSNLRTSYRPQCTTVWMLDCGWRCDDILGEHINLKTAERPIQCVECVD